MKRMKRRLPLCTQILGLLCLLPLVCCQHDLCVRPSNCYYGTVLPDPEGCQSFYECTDQRQWEHQMCHNSERFDVVQMACIKKNQAVCVDCGATIPTVVDSTVACAPPIPCVLDSVLGYPLSCRSYQICYTANNWKVFDCPSGLYFDIISSQCIGGTQEYTCQPTCESVTQDYDLYNRNNENEAITTPPVITIEPALLEIACNIVLGGTCSLLTLGARSYPDVNDCEQFYVCLNTWQSVPCPVATGGEDPYYYDIVSGMCHQDWEQITCALPCPTVNTQNTFTPATTTSTTSTTTSTVIPTTTASSNPYTSTDVKTTENLLTSSSGEHSPTNPPSTIRDITHEQTDNPITTVHMHEITTLADTTSTPFQTLSSTLSSTETTMQEPEATTSITTTHAPHTTIQLSSMTTSDIRSSEPYSSTTVMIGESCPAGVDVQSGDLVWPETIAGTVSRKEVCHPGLEGYVSRKCVRTADGGAQWDDLNFGMCVDAMYQQLLNEAEHLIMSLGFIGGNVDAVLELAEELAEVTANGTRAVGGMTPGNLNATVETIVLLTDLAHVDNLGNESGSSSPEGGNTGEEIAEEIVESVSAILSLENGDGWEELLEVDPNCTVQLLNVVDEVAERLAETAEPGRDISIVTNTVVVEVFPMEADETETVVFQGMTSMSPTEDPQIDAIVIPETTLTNLVEEMQMETVVVYGTYYNTLGTYLPSSGDMILNSRIISLSIRDVPFGTHLNPSVEMNFTLLNQSNEDVMLMCGYWNFTSRTSGYWSSEGCTMRHYSFTQASCECNHLTNFAVLMSPYAPAPHHVKILSLITIIGCLLSITGCLATLCLYIIAWKRIASEHAAVMLNLCVVLILANGLFLAGIERTENWIACTSVAALLHYLYLTACMIMLADGIEFVLYVMYVFHVKRRKETVLLLATCYVVPLTIVGISLSVTKLEGYGTDDYCWLAKENGLLWAFIGPVVVITVANFVILIKVLQTAAGSKAREHKGKFWSTIWNVTVILPLLGITWIFGIIAINEETVYFQYVFAILNSLQGFFIFIFHCALNKKLREAVVMKFSGRRSTASSMLSGKSAKSIKSKKSIVSNLSGESDKSGKSDKKSILSRKKKDSDAKSNKGKLNINGSERGTYTNGDIENAVYSEYITPSRAAAQNGYVQEVSGENDIYCDILEANMNPQNDLNKFDRIKRKKKGIRWPFDKRPLSVRSDRFSKIDRKSLERASRTSVKSDEKKGVAEEFLIMEPEYIDDNLEIHFIDNRSFFDDTANDSHYIKIDNLEDNSSVEQ